MAQGQYISPTVYGNLSVDQVIELNAAGNLISRDTFLFAWDTIGYAAATLLTPKELFIQRQAPEEYQSHTRNLQRDQTIIITELTVAHNIVSNNTGLEASDQMRFEQDSYIIFTIGDTVYPKIPLSAFLPYTMVRNGTGYAQIPNLGRWMGLKDVLLWSPNKSFKVSFVPANNITTPASGATTPISPDLISPGSTTGHSIYFKFSGRYKNGSPNPQQNPN